MSETKKYTILDMLNAASENGGVGLRGTISVEFDGMRFEVAGFERRANGIVIKLNGGDFDGYVDSRIESAISELIKSAVKESK